MGKILKLVCALALGFVLLMAVIHIDTIMPVLVMGFPFIVMCIIALAPLLLLIFIIFKLVRSKVGRILLVAIIAVVAIYVMSFRQILLDTFDFDTMQNYTIPTDTVSVDESFFM